ncbi:MAG: hypothetical protein ACLSDQ_07275 [Adlercreutzia equolifaciens]
MYFENPRFRDGAAAPEATVSSACAEALGLREGDAVEVTDAGWLASSFAVAAMRDDVVSVDYGWWHPEWGAMSVLAAWTSRMPTT